MSCINYNKLRIRTFGRQKSKSNWKYIYIHSMEIEKRDQRSQLLKL